MTLDLSQLANAQRLLFEIPLRPVQGQRFQPTGFPGLGAATFQTKDGACLLVESAQSMANRLELTIWDEAAQDVKAGLKGISHVKVVKKDGEFLTDSILESHRLNSPYVLNAKKGGALFFDLLGNRLNAFETGAINRKELAKTLLDLDIGCLIHGLFLSANINKKTLAGGRLRVARALSAFVEADGVKVAASGGVKNDHVNPSGDTKAGFVNVPFARDEFTAERITLYVNLDLAQIRGYGLGDDVEYLLVLMALYKLRALVDGGLRLRTACDLQVDPSGKEPFTAKSLTSFSLPDLDMLKLDLKEAITCCNERMAGSVVTYEEKIEPKKGNNKEGGEDESDEDDVNTEE